MTRYILALDPSGNFKEGKGTTGWCLYDTETNKMAKFGALKANRFKSDVDYWKEHVLLIDGLVGYTFTLVIEDYLLYANRATSQINSRFETPKLIGILQYECALRGIEVVFQTASAVKMRWPNNILSRKLNLEERNNRWYLDDGHLTNHILDAMRHAIHFATFGKKK